MTNTLIFTPTRFAVPESGFDSQNRYMRKVASGASLAVSAGRTWQIGYPEVNNGQPWCGFRFDIGVSGLEVNAVQTVVGGTTQSHNTYIPAVNPTMTPFVLQ